MSKPAHRLTADRRSLRYPSDLSDAEWVLVAPMIAPARRGGRRRSVDVREVLNAIFYVLSTGCQPRREQTLILAEQHEGPTGAHDRRSIVAAEVRDVLKSGASRRRVSIR